MDQATAQRYSEQMYLFTVPGDACPVWTEMFGRCEHMGFGSPSDHEVVPTPFATIEQALAELERLHPGVTVDTLCYDDEIAEARAMAKGIR